LERIEKGEIGSSFVITYHLSLDDLAEGYKNFCDKEGECIKVILKP
jgi:threonine dehydrogenase-like Zn-dependent dehydrogenase